MQNSPLLAAMHDRLRPSSEPEETAPTPWEWVAVRLVGDDDERL